MMQTLSGLPADEIRARLHTDGLMLNTPPFCCRIHSKIDFVENGLKLLYADYGVSDEAEFADFHIQLRRPTSVRRWIRPQVIFDFDGRTPFYPLPYEQAFPMFEWGLNWCVSNHMNAHLIVHAAVVALGDRAVILPGEPGAGKSTLCAALVNSGFRLLSDELTLIALDGTSVTPIPRPISLKNASIDVIKAFEPSAVLTPPSHDTQKGTVAHLKPPKTSVEQAHVPAKPAFIVFPRYQSGAETSLVPAAKADTLMRLVEQSFNYHILGKTGFDCLTSMLDDADCFNFEYSSLDEAINSFQQLFTA